MNQLLAIALLAGLALVLVALTFAATSFARRLRAMHPEAWASLAEQQRLLDTKARESDAVQTYLYRGGYFELGDPVLNRMGAAAAVLLVLALLLGGAMMAIPIPFSVLHCLVSGYAG